MLAANSREAWKAKHPKFFDDHGLPYPFTPATDFGVQVHNALRSVLTLRELDCANLSVALRAPDGLHGTLVVNVSQRIDRLGGATRVDMSPTLLPASRIVLVTGGEGSCNVMAWQPMPPAPTSDPD